MSILDEAREKINAIDEQMAQREFDSYKIEKHRKAA